MQAQGLTSLFPMEELSVMGLAEILPKYRHLKRRIAQTARAVLDFAPDILLTIDSPDFCLRVARQVRAAGSSVRTVHYVAPTVWAWRPGRARRMATCIDHVLALFPFEPPFMEAAGMECDFVGHPVVADPTATDAEVANFRQKHSLPAPDRTLLVLAGSRKGEVARMMDVFVPVLKDPRFADTTLIFPTLPHVAEGLRRFTDRLPQRVLVLDGAGQSAETAAHTRRIAAKAAGTALATSGTVSLELAAAGTPMIIAYDMNWLSRQIISRMLRTDTVTLVNLVAGTRTVPEFIGAHCKPAPIANALHRLQTDDNGQSKAMETTLHRLGQGAAPPGLRAAKAVLDRANLVL